MTTNPERGPYDLQLSPLARKRRKELPREILPALWDALDKLTEDPSAFPERTHVMDPKENIRLYVHPGGVLEIMYQVIEDAHRLLIWHIVERVPITKLVFISYSRKDAIWLDKLRECLRPLELQGLVQVWDDTELSPGVQWMEEIQQWMSRARVAVFLVSQHFLSSEFIRDKELPVLLKSAKDHGCRVFWVAISTSTVRQSELWKFQAANDPDRPLDTLPQPDQDEVLRKIHDHVRNAVEAV